MGVLHDNDAASDPMRAREAFALPEVRFLRLQRWMLDVLLCCCVPSQVTPCQFLPLFEEPALFDQPLYHLRMFDLLKPGLKFQHVTLEQDDA